jgi:hypothetical protein
MDSFAQQGGFAETAGAEMRVSLRWSPAFNCSIKHGCDTNSGRRGDIELGPQDWHGHFTLPDGIAQPTLPVNQEFWMPSFYHILSILTMLSTYL